MALLHFSEDVNPTFFGLSQGLAHNLPINPVDLDIHLQRGNAVTGADHLEIHVAEMIFVAEDIGKDNHLDPPL